MPKERALIEIRLAGLSQGIHEFDFTCTAGDFNDQALTEAGISGEISVRIAIDRNEDGMTVSLDTNASAERPCDLCLTPVSLKMNGSYRLYYMYDQDQGVEEDLDIEYRSIDRNSVSIDLTEDVRETLLLSVPMKVTCTDNPDCHIYRKESPEEPEATQGRSWQESLEKLKDKYR
ncbi:MAG: DUF177 domain-containing protein [Chlorobiaceae bacterium]|nr:DUF177 domain-containing protein [Chlorobiaceae bacterium]NTW74279.1 DUF177 domain-containing protein [Chlorobiaceae bacterium]